MQANKEADNSTILSKVVDKFLEGRLNKTGCGRLGFKKCETETSVDGEDGEACSWLDERRGLCGKEEGKTDPSEEGGSEEGGSDRDTDSTDTVDATESDAPVDDGTVQDETVEDETVDDGTVDDDTDDDGTVDTSEEETPATEATVAKCTWKEKRTGQCGVTCSCGDTSKRDVQSDTDAPETGTTQSPEPGTEDEAETDRESTRKERFRALIIKKFGKMAEIFFLFIDIKDQLLCIMITSSVLLWFSAVGHIAHLVILIFYDTSLDYIYIYYPGTSIEMDYKPVVAADNSLSAPNGAPV